MCSVVDTLFTDILVFNLAESEKLKCDRKKALVEKRICFINHNVSTRNTKMSTYTDNEPSKNRYISIIKHVAMQGN